MAVNRRQRSRNPVNPISRRIEQRKPQTFSYPFWETLSQAGLDGYVIKPVVELDPSRHEELINRVRGYEFDGYERTVDSHVKNLRRKIEANPSEPRIVETVLSAGYRFGLHRDT